MKEEMQRTNCKDAGFTIIELLITIVIGGLLLSFATLSIRNFYISRNLSDEADIIVATLKTAQEKSFNQEGGSRWGVYFENEVYPARDKYYLFEVDEAEIGSPWPGPAVDDQPVETRTIQQSLDLQAPSEGTNETIIFSKVNGRPSAATTIVVNNYGASPADGKTITIEAGGQITY